MNCWQNCECEINKKKEKISGNCEIIEVDSVDMGVNQLAKDVPRQPHQQAPDHARGSKQRPRKEQLPEVKYEHANTTEKKAADGDDLYSDTSTDDSEIEYEEGFSSRVMSSYGKNVSKGAKSDGTRQARNPATVPTMNLSPREEKELQKTLEECEELMCHPECAHLEEEVNCEWLGHLVTVDSCGYSQKDQVKGFGVLNNARHLVSKSKKRYINKKDGFDLDLVYITNRVIAMGFPSVGTESMYRNPREECIRFLETYHKGRWRIYNLCSEKAHQYPADAFGGNWRGFPFDDHCPPTLNLMAEFCLEASTFMQKHPDNVIAIHCKAGKGRTGTMICALMLYAYGAPDRLVSILRDYGSRRSWKGAGVTIPAQIHALSLFSECISGPSKMRQPASFLRNPCVKVEKPPTFHLRELVMGPFYSARINNPSLRTFFGNIKADVENITPEWLPKNDPARDWNPRREGNYMRLRLRIEISQGSFGRIEIRIARKPDPLVAICWVHYPAMRRKRIQEAIDDGDDTPYFSQYWLKPHMSNLGKKDAKKHVIVPPHFNCEAIFSILGADKPEKSEGSSQTQKKK